MDRKWTFLSGVSVGASLMFLFEPSAARRRALVRDKAVSASKRLGRFSSRAARDLANRSRGVVAELRARLRDNRPTGQILAQRVRSRIGRAVSDPGAIQVLVNEGRVTLRGPVLRSELDDLVNTVSRVRGVDEVVDELEVPETPGSVRALQRRRMRAGLGNWSPAARLLSGLAAGTVAVFAMARRVA
jgi:osmotically-inducible protein OsmY